MTARKGRHPVTERLPFGDDRAMAAFWGAQATRSIRAAIADPAPATVEDLEMNHAVRATMMAAWHALRVLGRPSWQEMAKKEQ